jgi:hypothetical protein
MSSDPIKKAHDMARTNLARLDNLLDWVIYAKAQLNGDENPALVEALNNIGVGIAQVDIDADQFVRKSWHRASARPPWPPRKS